MRWILAAGFIGTLLGLIHFRRHERGTGHYREWHEWVIMFPQLGGLLAIITWVWAPRSMLNPWTWVPWIGAVGALCGVLLMFWALQEMQGNFANSVRCREWSSLITSGPYRFSRHPFYTGTLMSMLGTLAITADVFVAITGLAYAVMIWVRIAAEEAWLRDRYPFSYNLYCKRTGRFFTI